MGGFLAFDIFWIWVFRRHWKSACEENPYSRKAGVFKWLFLLAVIALPIDIIFMFLRYMG